MNVRTTTERMYSVYTCTVRITRHGPTRPNRRLWESVTARTRRFREAQRRGESEPV